MLQTVLTGEKISRVLDVANDPHRYDEAREHRLTGQDVQELMENPERLVLAAGRTAESREFLGRFIAGIQVHGEKAVICYSIPLPEDSPLAGMRRQEIDLPAEILAWWTTTGTCPPPMAIHWRHPDTCRDPKRVGNIAPSLLMNDVQADPHPKFGNLEQ